MFFQYLCTFGAFFLFFFFWSLFPTFLQDFFFFFNRNNKGNCIFHPLFFCFLFFLRIFVTIKYFLIRIWGEMGSFGVGVTEPGARRCAVTHAHVYSRAPLAHSRAGVQTLARYTEPHSPLHTHTHAHSHTRLQTRMYAHKHADTCYSHAHTCAHSHTHEH